MKTFALTIFGALAGTRYLVLDPTKLDSCNVLQSRIAFSKMVSLLFNSDSLSGNAVLTHKALLNPDVWIRVNSLSPAAAGRGSGFLSQTARISDCEDVNTLIEVATTVGAGFASGEMTTNELAETVLELVDNNIHALNISRLVVRPEELKSLYYTSSVVTPLLTVLPSCVKPPFQIPKDAEFNWRTALAENARSLISDLFKRYDNCGDCAIPVIEIMADVAEVKLPENFVKSIMSNARDQISNVLDNVKSEEIPTTLGGVIAYAIRMQGDKATLGGDGRSSSKVNNMAENLVAFLDAMNYELINGRGPIMDAIDAFYRAMGC